MNTEALNRENRLESIRKHLKRGDKKQIAELAGVHRVWVSYVIKGDGVSERILSIAEDLISKRDRERRFLETKAVTEPSMH